MKVQLLKQNHFPGNWSSGVSMPWELPVSKLSAPALCTLSPFSSEHPEPLEVWPENGVGFYLFLFKKCLKDSVFLWLLCIPVSDEEEEEASLFILFLI